MNQSSISWYIKEDEDYIQDNDYYLGSFSPSSDIVLNIQVWNNRYGNESVDNIENARLSIYFDTVEDSSLLQYCSISVNGEDFVEPTIYLNRGTVEIGNLYGTYNNGLEDIINADNYKDISIKFSNLPTNLKNGLKNLFLDIEFD
jgi:hypothetical protein